MLYLIKLAQIAKQFFKVTYIKLQPVVTGRKYNTIRLAARLSNYVTKYNLQARTVEAFMLTVTGTNMFQVKWERV